MYYGSAWYPEHWPEARWREDLRLMREAGMNVVRIAEFAWSRLEPAEGCYELDWIERAVAAAAEFGIETVIGTPTAAPPAWLTRKYPDVLAVRESGHPERHGGRGHYSPANPRYQRFCVGIASAMAERFGRNPHVIGWQIDNEYWPYSFDPHTLGRFHAWLKDRYGTLGALNAAWSNTYWSQEYTDWAQIPAWHGWQNPCLLLMGRRFMSEVCREYQRLQYDAIRSRVEPRQWITHNFHAHKNLDFGRIGREVDFVSWDPYAGPGHLNADKMGRVLDFCRGIQGKNFWVMETQPGTMLGPNVNVTLNRGEVRRMVWHQVGHGADAVLFWQWRSALGGQEQYHGTIVAPDGSPRPLYEEVKVIGAEFARAAQALAGTTPVAPVAMLDTYPDRWALELQKHHDAYDPVTHLQSLYAPLRALGLNVDIVQPDVDLRKYRLVIAPHLHILTPAIVQNLARFIETGGHLVLGPRSGFKDEHNALLPSRQPGADLSALLCAQVAEFYALEADVPVAGRLGEGACRIWAEYLAPGTDDVEILLRYGKSNGWLDGQPAAVTRRSGAGRITYIGAWLDDALSLATVRWACEQAQVATPWDGLPNGVEISSRTSADRNVYIICNHGTSARKLVLPFSAFNLLEGRAADRELMIPANEVVVLTESKVDPAGARSCP
jgi:beta-galactosidase